MATTTPLPPSSSQPQAPTQSQLRQAQYNNLVTYTSLGALIFCPLLIALPPRKFDFYTVLLISGTALGGNQVLREYTGRGIVERVSTPARLALPSEHAGQIQERLREDRPLDPRGGSRNEKAMFGTGIGSPRAADGLGTTAAVARAVQQMKAAEATQEPAEREPAEQEPARPSQEAGAGGGAPRRKRADWKAAREAREKEAREGGRGYGGLIVDQIWEVWNWGRERPDDAEGAGEEAGVGGKGKEGRK
jgi:hypothetical protein